MGTWGKHCFENDDACDWFSNELEGTKGLFAVSHALQSVAELGEDEYLDVPSACSALAAAEVLAAVLGRPSSLLPSNAAQWVADNPSQDAASLVSISLRAIRRIVENSELQECWDDTGDSSEWRNVLAALSMRLTGSSTDELFGTASNKHSPVPRSEERNRADYGPKNILARKLKSLSLEDAYHVGWKDGHRETSACKGEMALLNSGLSFGSLEGFRQAKLAAIELLRRYNDFDSEVIAEYVRGWLESSRLVQPDR